MISAAAIAPMRAESFRDFSRARPNRKPEANKSPAPVVSTNSETGSAFTVTTVFAAHDHGALLATRNGGNADFTTQLVHRLVEILGLIKRFDLRLIAEENVDMIGHEMAESRPVAFYAEEVGKGQRGFAIGGSGEFCGVHIGGFRFIAVEEIAFQIDDLGSLQTVTAGFDIILGDQGRAAPRKVDMERLASGVTLIRQRAVAGPSLSGGVSKDTPIALMSWRKISPNWSSATLPI